MDYSASENESLSEVETLRQQLQTYKNINIDLSKKIQESKIELNVYRQENAQIRKELLEERAKAAEYRNYFTMINTHCMKFVNTYVASMQQISENDMTLIENLPALRTPDISQHNEGPQEPTQVPIAVSTKEQHATVRSQLQRVNNDDDETGNNVLNTIVEESILPYTSTPIVLNRNANNEISDQVSAVGLSETSSITSNTNDDILETPRTSINPRRVSILRQNSIHEELNNENEINPDDTTEKTFQYTTVKECRVALSQLNSGYLRNTGSQNSGSYEDEETVDETNENESKSKKVRAVKRKSSEGRPRRRARPSTSALTEPSLRVKLRRSPTKKDKKKKK